jgi:FkbM family methyltransferase
LRVFLKSGLKLDKIIAFEPDKENFKKLRKYLDKAPKITNLLINEAAYNYNGTVPFNFYGNSSSSVVNRSSLSGAQVKCRTLDFLLQEKNNLIIKLDTEGAEWQIIGSAYKLIRTKKPLLAVSLYHHISDIIDIPILFESFVRTYNFFLRAHSSNGCGLYLYCIPKTKANKKIKIQPSFSIFSKKISFQEFNKIASTNFRSSARASGFPDVFRNQGATVVHQEIIEKLNLKNLKNKKVVEIGPGVSPLPHMMSSFCRSHKILLKFIDGSNVLGHLPTATFIEHFPDEFPANIDNYFSRCANAGAVICYSVSQYISSYSLFVKLIKCATSLLAPGGRLLLGDIPNSDMRMRFLNSKTGEQSKSYIYKNKIRYNRFLQTQSTYLNDANLINILTTQRNKGYHAWIVPQKNLLPQSNKREDLLIERL